MMRRQPWLFVAMVWPVLVLLQLSSSSGSYHRQSPITILSRNSRMILMVESLLFAFRHSGVVVVAAAEEEGVSATETADSSSDFPTDDGTLTLSSVSAKIHTKDGVCNVAVPGIGDNDDDDEYEYDEEEEDEDEDEKVFLRVTATGLMSVSSARRKYMTIRVENMHPSEVITVHNIHVEREKTELLKSKSGAGNVGQEWEGEIDIPQQLHVSNEFRNGFSVNPGERVTIPMRFLARFPELGTHHHRDNNDDTNSRWINVDKPDDSLPDETEKQSQPHSSSSSFSHSSSRSRGERLDLANLLGRDITKVLFDGKPLVQPCTRGRSYNDKGSPSQYGCDQRRDNLRVDDVVEGYGDTYEVSTKITIETSRGYASFPFTATTIRENLFGIPDSIKFYHPNFSGRNTDHGREPPSMDEANDLDDHPPSALPSSSPESIKSSMDNLRSLGGFSIHGRLVANDDGRDIDYPEQSESSMGDSDIQVGKTKDSMNDCFDLYLSNPRTAELNITEVSVSKPEFMGLEVDNNRIFSDDMADSNQPSSSSLPSQTIREWTKDEPLTLLPGASDVYFLTICTKHPDTMEEAINDTTDIAVTDIRWSPEVNHPDRDLGLLQIRFNDEYEFAVVLEHSDIAQTTVTQAKSDDSADPTTQQVAPQEHVSFLQSVPKRLDFLLLSVSSPSVEHHFSLQNRSPDPIRIMSAVVLIDVQDGGDAKSEELGLQVDIRLNGENIFKMISSGSGLGHFVVEPFSTVEDIFTVECSLDPSSAVLSGAKVGDFEFNGTIIVRGTQETGIRFDEWRDDMRRNPYRDDHMLAELPFSISIVKPRVDAIIDRSTHPYPQLFASQGWDSTAMAVSFLFFPMTTFDAEKNTEDALPTQSYVGSNKIEHDLRISSNVATAIELEGGRVIDSEENSTDSLCARFNVTKISSVSSIPPEGSDEIGHLSLVYRFDIFKRSDTQQTFMYPRSGDDLNVPKTCYLEIITSFDEEFGPFQIPLVIFPGNLELSPGAESVDGPAPGMKMGFDNLLSWTKNSGTGLGNSLIKNLGAIVGGKVKDKSDLNMLASYIRRLTKDKARRIKSRFYPVLLNMGTIDNGKIAKAPLYFTNLNPIPVRLSIDVGDVEGMSISLSRIEGQSLGDGNSLLDALPTYGTDGLIEEGKFEGHPIAGVLEFLSSDEQTLALTSSFNFRDAVDYDSDAIDRFPFLAFLHEWYSSATFHRSPTPNNYETKSSTSCEEGRPPPYMTSETTDGDGRVDGMFGPLMLSSNGKRIQALKECSRRKTFSVPNGSTIQIPPGGKARLEIQIRGPPQDYLENDISQLLATGLVLSTNFGGIMPIFVEFEALQGQLYGSLIDSSGNESATADIPVRLSWDSDREKTHQPGMPPQVQNLWVNEEKSRKVPLLLHSSFTSPIRLQTIESCNPWFRFGHVGSEEDGRGDISEEKNNAGFVETMVDCSDSTKGAGEIKFPSYYQCALNWLNDRVKLQPDGCGLKATKASVFKHTHLEKVKRSVERANRVLKREYNEMNDIQRIPMWSEHSISKPIKTGRKRGDGVVTNLDIFSVASNNLRVASEHGVSTMSSSLRATIEYASADSTHRQNLSLAVHGIVAQAKLDPPRLFDPVSGSLSILSFGRVAIGATSTLYVPIRNPTSVPVRVRLAVPARNADHSSGRSFLPPFVQNTNVTDHPEWWTGNGDFYLQDDRGDVVKSHHNISIKAGAGAHVSLLNPSLQSQSVLLLGCGVRCALRGDENRMKDTAASTGTTHPIGASSAAGITLSGTTWIGTADDNADVGDPILLSGGTSIPYSGGPSAFAIPYAALDEIVIPPFGTAELGPIIFRPPGRYRTLGCTAVRESGARHLNKAKRDMCRDSNFDSVVYLENSLTGLESVVLNGRTRWKRLIFLDQPGEGGDVYGDIEVIDGRETLVFSGVGKTSSRESIGPFPRSKEILLHNEGDEDLFISRIFLSGENGARSNNNLSCVYGSFRLPNCSDEYILLEPDESLPIVIEHIPNCNSKKEYVLLNVETVEDRVWSSLYDNDSNLYGSKRGSGTRGYDPDNPFETSTFTLSVGYQMDGALFSRCVPVVSQRSRYLSTMEKGESSLSNETKSALLAQSDNKGRSSLLVELLLLLIAAGLLCFNTRIRSSSVHGVPPSKLENNSAIARKNVGKKTRIHWNTAFRCFARVDPGASELQALSKEQMRQVVIGHYKAKGTAPPAALANASIFTRDRRAVGGSSARQRTRETAGNERLRTLSDALFQNAVVSENSSLSFCLPVGLGWKTALNRGVVTESSQETTGLIMTSENLLRERKRLLDQEEAMSDDRPTEPEICDEEEYESKDVDSNENGAAVEKSTKSREDASVALNATKIDSKPVVISGEIRKNVTDREDGDAFAVNLSERKQSKLADNEASIAGEHGTQKKQPAIVARSSKSSDAVNKDDTENSVKRNKSEKAKKQQGKGGASLIVNTNQKGNSASASKNNGNEASEKTSVASDSKRGRHERPSNRGKDEKNGRDSGSHSTQPKKKNDKQTLAIDSQKTGKAANSKRTKGEQGSSPSIQQKITTGPEKSSRTKGKSEKQSSLRQTKKQTKKGANDAKESNVKQPKDESNEDISSSLPLRPPPGLAPPPGFGSTSTTLSTVAGSETANAAPTTSSQPQPTLETMLNSALSNPDVDLNAAVGSFQPMAAAGAASGDAATNNLGGSDLLLGLQEASRAVTDHASRQSDAAIDELFSTVLPGLTSTSTTSGGGAAGPNTSSSPNTNIPQPSIPDILDRSSSENGFDVMDFLDSILNEGSLRTDDDGQIEQVGSSRVLGAGAGLVSSTSDGESLTGKTNESNAVAPGSSAPVFENPWASDGTSRAEAYGISFDDGEGKQGRPSSSSTKGIPTSSAIRKHSDSEDINDASAPIFGALSESTASGSLFGVATTAIGTTTTGLMSSNDRNIRTSRADLPMLLTPAALLSGALERDDDHEDNSDQHDDDEDVPNLLSSFYAFGDQQQQDGGEEGDEGDD